MKNQKRYQKAVDEFVRRVLEKYRNKIERIILFGSVARGEAKEDSDVDILVIGDVSLEELVDISFPILLEHRKLISAKNVKREHFDFFVHEEYSFARNILREGIILYERVGEAFGESKGEAEIGKSPV